MKADSKVMNQQPALERLEPNFFDLQGYDTQISYTIDLSGQPLFSYSDRSRSRNFSGEEIQEEETKFGRAVTVFLENNEADQGFESVTLLLPAVQLTTETRELPIQTLAILSRRFVFLNPANPTQQQSYNTIYLHGTAQFVQTLSALNQ